MTGLVVPVVVEGWQYECCGEPPAVGLRVSWRLHLDPDGWSAAAVDLPVSVESVPPEALVEWRALGNRVGAAPALLRHRGLTVYLPDHGLLDGGRARGILREDHHVDVPLGVPVTDGTITRVRLVSREYRARSRLTLVPVSGTEELVEVGTAPASLPHEKPSKGALTVRQTAEVLVDLEVDPD
ncbi:MAG TPA: DUF6578 domain-containing protein [Friedmanniella sp.]